MNALEIKLIGINLSSGKSYTGETIPANFFADQKDEIEIEDLIINGVSFHDAVCGYSAITALLEKLEDFKDSFEVVSAILNKKGLIENTAEVFDFYRDTIIEVLLNNDTLTSLEETVGDDWSNDQLDTILKHLPKHLHEVTTNYFDHDGYKRDLFINELGYAKAGKVEFVYKRRG